MNPVRSTLNTAQIASLVERWQRGDTAAADKLIEQQRFRLEHLARRMLPGYPKVRAQVQTDDVVLKACARLLNALKKMKKPPESRRHFTNLGSQQIQRELIDLARHFSKWPHEPLDEAAGIVAPDPGIHEEMENLELWATFHEALESLPDEEREVMKLWFYQGFTDVEVAEILGVDPSTARRRRLRALNKIREKMGDWLPPEE